MHMNWSSGIDPGAYGVRMMGRAGSLKLNESAACALRGETLVALGDDARAMEARVKGIRVVYPMTTGGGGRNGPVSVVEIPAERGRERVLLSRPPTMLATQMRLLTALTLDWGHRPAGWCAAIACARRRCPPRERAGWCCRWALPRSPPPLWRGSGSSPSTACPTAFRRRMRPSSDAPGAVRDCLGPVTAEGRKTAWAAP